MHGCAANLVADLNEEARYLFCDRIPLRDGRGGQADRLGLLALQQPSLVPDGPQVFAKRGRGRQDAWARGRPH